MTRKLALHVEAHRGHPPKVSLRRGGRVVGGGASGALTGQEDP